MKKKIFKIGIVLIVILLGFLLVFDNYKLCKKIGAKFYFKDIYESGQKDNLATNPKWKMDIHFDYYYLLNCYKDDKKYLKDIDSLRKIIWINNLKKEYILMTDSLKRGNNVSTDSSNRLFIAVIFIKGTKNFGTSFHSEDRDMGYINNANNGLK